MRLNRFLGVSAALALTATLAACGDSSSISGEPTAPEGGSSDAIVVGSSNYYSNEIIAEIFAQALEGAGFTVQRDFSIGAREVHYQEMADGAIDVFPEYSGPLLQFLNQDNEITGADEIYEALKGAVEENLQVLDQAEATDQDSYVVSREFSEANGITSLADLADYDGDLVVGGSSEFESRPNGPKGLAEHYGVEVGFTPIEDKGGPLTVKALLDGDIQLANIFTASPAINQNDLVVLDDPEGMFLASHVIGLAAADLDPAAVDVINGVLAKLTDDGLREINARVSENQEQITDIASDWIEQNL